MHPDLDDILSAVQRLLMNEFVPVLAATTPFLAEQALYANLILEYCRKSWPQLHLRLAAEHGDLCATLGVVAGALRDDAAANSVTTAIDGELARGVTDVARTPVDVLGARNRTLRDLVSRVVVLLDGQPEVARGTARAAARAATDAYLVRAADWQYADLQQLGVLW